jgi:hypothetical protein
MRRSIWLAAVAAALAVASSSRAQFTIAFGPTTTSTQNVPITVPANTPIASPQTFNNSFSLANMMPKFTLPNVHALFGKSTFPNANNLAGRSYLNSFGYTRPGPIGP